MDRRRFLAYCAASVSALAGCGTDSRRAGTDAPTTTPTVATPVTSPRASDVPALDGDWRCYRHDAANTGATDDPGPVDDPVERWARGTTTGAPVAAPAVADGTFVVVTAAGAVYARDAADGDVRWRLPERVDTAVAPVASDDTAVVAHGSTVRGIEVATGEERWTATLDERVRDLALSGERVVVATESRLSSVALADGTARWRRRTDDPIVTPPAAGEDAVAVGLTSGVAVFDASTGERRWHSSVDTEPAFAPAVGDGTVYLGTESRVVALAADGGDLQWERTLHNPVAAPPVVTADAVYVSTLGDDAGSPTPRSNRDGTLTPPPTGTKWFAATVVSLSTRGGREQWRVEVTETYSFTSGPPDGLPLVVAADALLVDLGGTLRAYDAATGDARWSASGGGVLPATTNGVVSTGAVGVDLGDGSVQWRFGTADTVSPQAVVDNTVYVGGDDSYCYALAADTGTLRWTARTDGAIRATPAVGDDAVYVGTMEGTLYAVDRVDGSERWSFDVGGQVRSPTLTDGTVYVGNFSPTVTAVDAASGREQWRTTVDRASGTGFVALELAATEETVYAGSNGDLRAFDADDGAERWRVTADERPAVQSPPVVADDAVLVNVGESLRALDPADGTERWTGATGGSNQPPVVADGTVYAPGDGAVYAFDLADGTERWTASVGRDLQLAVGDAVYGLGFETPLVALDPDDGQTRWTHAMRATTPPAIADDHLFVGGTGGTVHAVAPDPR